jgi:glycosyltransferase involved in cell wall biosynthesis
MYESLACGVPVVAFDAGGVPDAVRHLETGYLAPLRDRLASNARAMMVSEFSLERQVTRFSTLHSSVLPEASLCN